MRQTQTQTQTVGQVCEDILNIKKKLERKELYTNPSGLMSFDI
jgi:hypothetical protein